MTLLDDERFRRLVDAARMAPSVHNIQPTRFTRHGDTVTLLADPSRRLPVADATGHDVRLSHGTVLEGLALALARMGLAIDPSAVGGEPRSDGLIPVASGAVRPIGADRDILHDATEWEDAIASRVSWRGVFQPSDAAVTSALDRLTAADLNLTLLRNREAIETVADLTDAAGFHFLSDDAHRAELLHWMRLAPRHPLAARDGLSAQAMALGRLEAFGAGLVLGPLFGLLKSMGLAKPLTSDATKTRSAAAIVLFHRPRDEDPLLTGRAFYRAWLAMERHGLVGCPLSVLVDWPPSHAALQRMVVLPADRRLVNVFRLGFPAGKPDRRRARLPVAELIVP
jgi:hypothetical protein